MELKPIGRLYFPHSERMENVVEARAYSVVADEERDLSALLIDAAETLLCLPTVPEAQLAASTLRQMANSPSSPKDKSVLFALHRIYKRLLIEATPDYWVDQMPNPNETWDADHMEMTIAVTYERQRQANLIAVVIKRLNVSSGTDTNSMDVTRKVF